MDSNGTLDSLSSLLSFFYSFVSLCLSLVMIVACVLYWRKYKDMAGALMLAGKLVSMPGIIASLFFWRWGMDAFKETHSFMALGWMASVFWPVSAVGGVLFLVGFGLLIWPLTDQTLDIDYFRRRWPIHRLSADVRNASLAIFFGALFVAVLSWFLIMLMTEGTRDIDYSRSLVSG